MTVTNEFGDQEDEYTLTLSVTKKKTTWTTHPIFRYARINVRAYGLDFDAGGKEVEGLVGITRYAATNYGPGFPARNNIGSWSLSKKQEWGASFYNQVEARFSGYGGTVGDNTFWNGSSEQEFDMTGMPWTLEGISTFAFRTGESGDPNPPKDTKSIRDIFVGNQTQRDYFGWPKAGTDYYIYHKPSIDTTVVPSNVYQPTRTLAVGVQRPYGALQHRLGESITSDGATSADFHPDYNTTSNERWLNRGDTRSYFKLYNPAYNPPSGLNGNSWAPVNEGTYSWAE